MIFLDTNFLIHALISDTKPEQMLRQWVRDGEIFLTNAIAWAEFRCGAGEAFPGFFGGALGALH